MEFPMLDRGALRESFANIDHKINFGETDKWLPILDNL